MTAEIRSKPMDPPIKRSLDSISIVDNDGNNILTLTADLDDVVGPRVWVCVGEKCEYLPLAYLVDRLEEASKDLLSAERNEKLVEMLIQNNINRFGVSPNARD